MERTTTNPITLNTQQFWFGHAAFSHIDGPIHLTKIIILRVAEFVHTQEI